MNRSSTLKFNCIALAVSQALLMPLSADATLINVGFTCSLSEAITTANDGSGQGACEIGDASGPDTISLPANVTFTLENSLPVISSNISIQGNGATITRSTAMPEPTLRHFELGANSSLYLDSINLTNGNMEQGSSIYAGYATTLVITNSEISGNSTSGIGGRSGIFTNNTDISISNSVITNNAGGLSAGVFQQYGDFSLSSSTVSMNNSSSRAGLYLYNCSDINISDSSINNNNSAHSGVYVANYYASATVGISNTHIDGNTGTRHPGLRLQADNPGSINISATINNSTISTNSAASYNAGVYMMGQVSATITGSSVSNNASNVVGVAGLQTFEKVELTIEGSVVEGNTAVLTSGVSANDSTLALTNSNVINNTSNGMASVFQGAGISLEGSSLIMTGGRVSGNRLTYSAGGGVKGVDSSVSLSDVTVASNTALGEGGGIHLSGSASTLQMLGTTVSGNVVSDGGLGGGLFLDDGNSAAISNSTISGNTADNGSGFYLRGWQAVSVANVTVTNNASPGAAVSLGTVPAVIALNNTLVGANTGADCGAALPGAFIADNWFEDASCSGVAQGDPQLAALADNGGVTETHALLPASGAINLGNNSICVSATINSVDQRGFSRVDRCDIGAFETTNDFDGDGALNDVDAFPLDPNESLDTDNDNIGNNADLDDDGDNVPDTEDAFPLDKTESADFDNDNIGDNADPDDDNDNVPDVSDVFPFDASESADFDRDNIGDNADPDDDNDNVPDVVDAFPFDPSESADFDWDNIGDNADPDDDNDNVPDTSDAFPFDSSESADFDKDNIGDNADPDDDNDNVPDTSDAFPFDSSESADFDRDNIGDNADPDDDNDNVPDAVDAFPLDASESADSDGDGQGDNADLDDDNDNVPDTADNCQFDRNANQLDTDGDQFGNVCDSDDDNDTILDASDNCPVNANRNQADRNNDGVGDACDEDDVVCAAVLTTTGGVAAVCL